MAAGSPGDRGIGGLLWACRGHEQLLDSALGGRGTIEVVTSQDARDGLLMIGDFARQTRLTTKALRIYDETGLLRPADVDGSNGYRRYAMEQMQTARLIGLLRGVDLGLADIGLLLTDIETDRELAVQRLGRHLSELEALHSNRRLLIRHIDAILQGKTTPCSRSTPAMSRHNE